MSFFVTKNIFVCFLISHLSWLIDQTLIYTTHNLFFSNFNTHYRLNQILFNKKNTSHFQTINIKSIIIGSNGNGNCFIHFWLRWFVLYFEKLCPATRPNQFRMYSRLDDWCNFIWAIFRTQRNGFAAIRRFRVTFSPYFYAVTASFTFEYSNM